MRQVWITKAGAPEVLKLQENRDPMPRTGEVRIRVRDGDGVLVPTTTTMTLEVTLGQWQVEDVDPEDPGVQTVITSGERQLMLRAPAQVGDREGRSEIRVTVADLSNQTTMMFEPAPRPLLITGLLEGRWDFWTKDANSLFPVRNRFEDELRDFAIDSDDGRHRVAGRGVLFLKGTVADDYLVTVRLESEEDERARLFRDIRPDELYPIYGDASLKDFDAQSRNRFFGRIDKDRSYVMYGDYLTPQVTEARTLGAFNRSLNGARHHLETRWAQVDAFATRGRFGMVVDEFPGQGVSGPYALTRPEGIINSERVELLTRDRNDPTVILAIEPQSRFADYTIEPFTGRLVFRHPIPSVDENLNPVSIRVSYETETGGDEFWIYGVNGQFSPAAGLEIGGSVVRDENPFGSHEILSGNTTVQVAENTFVIGELVATDSAGSHGEAVRGELRHRSSHVDFRAFGLWTGDGFYNPSSGVTGGRLSVGARGRIGLDANRRVLAEALRIEDRLVGGRRQGVSVGFEQDVGERFRWELGFRRSEETRTPASEKTAGTTPNETNALRVRLTGKVGPRGTIFGEYEQDVLEATQRRAAVGADVRVLKRLRLYAKHEFISSFAGPFALNTDQSLHSTVLGLTGDYLENGHVFSEYRVRDAISGREGQAAIGVRNRWTLSEGLRLDASLERVKPIKGTGENDAAAVGVGIEYTRGPAFRSTARIEFRTSGPGEEVFGTVGLAKKLGRDWSVLGRSAVSVFFKRRLYERSQLGFAWRQVERKEWNALMRYEHKFERDESGPGPRTRREVHILSLHASRKLSNSWTLEGQGASKVVRDESNGLEAKTDAHLIALRSTTDLTSWLDFGLNARSLFSGNGESSQYGLGAELGLIVAGNVRLAGGYNVFGFRDEDLVGGTLTDHGFYIHLGVKFDESILGGGLFSPSTRAVGGGSR